MIRVLIRQIAGLIARRIICPLQAGQEIERGFDFGMIRFGSQTEIVIPARNGIPFQAQVQLGQMVQGGKTVLGGLVRMKNPRHIAVIPNIITLCNAVCGFISLTLIAGSLVIGEVPALDRLNQAAWFILAGMLFDVFRWQGGSCYRRRDFSRSTTRFLVGSGDLWVWHLPAWHWRSIITPKRKWIL